MNQYEKLIGIIQNESIRHNTESIKIGIMRSAKKCEINGLVLDQDDLYIADHLTEKICTKVDIKLVNGEIVDKSEYSKPLKAGDMVLLYRINDEKYAIIERVI